MRPTADFCRAQAQHHRAKAVSEMLENRRAISLLAAKSWEAAAALADKRVSTNGSPLDRLDAEITLEFAREAEEGSKN